MAKKGGNLPNQREKNGRKSREENSNSGADQMNVRNSREQESNRRGDTSRTSSQGRKESSGGQLEE